MSAAKKKKPNGNDVGINMAAEIFLNDHLLWEGVKEMIDRGMLFLTKCFEGRIKVRERQDGPLVMYFEVDSNQEWKRVKNVTTNISYKKRSINVCSPENANELAVGNDW